MQTAENPPQHNLGQRIASRLKKGAYIVWETLALDTRGERVKPENITVETVARIICREVNNPVQRLLSGDEYINGFNLKILLANMGFIGGDCYQKFPEAWQTTTRVLRELEGRGVLTKIGCSEEDARQGNLSYRVARGKEQELKELSAKASVDLSAGLQVPK